MCGSSGPRALSEALQDRLSLAGAPHLLGFFISRRSHSLLSRNKGPSFSYELLLLFQEDGGKQYHSLTNTFEKLSAFQCRAGSCQEPALKSPQQQVWPGAASPATAAAPRRHLLPISFRYGVHGQAGMLSIGFALLSQTTLCQLPHVVQQGICTIH